MTINSHGAAAPNQDVHELWRHDLDVRHTDGRAPGNGEVGNDPVGAPSMVTGRDSAALGFTWVTSITQGQGTGGTVTVNDAADHAVVG